jgi:hypothetical protein
MGRDGGLLVDVLRIRVSWPDGTSKVLLPMHFPVADLHPDTCRVEGQPSVIFVRSHEEAQAECLKYDPLPWLGKHFIDSWRGSMSADDYYPVEAPGGRHSTYSEYRMNMIDSNSYLGSLSLAHFFGDDLFETLERAARLDRNLIVNYDAEPTQTETRAVVVRSFAARDPENNIDDAIHQKPHEELLALEEHVIVNGQLCCPFCKKPRDRASLWVEATHGPTSKRYMFVWGCRACIPDMGSGLSLDRIPTIGAALKWTDHLLSKPHYQHPKAVKSWLACLRGIFGEALALRGRL